MLLSEFLQRSPPKVTFRRFSEMYLANYVAFCGMSVCVLLILYCFTGPRGLRANPGGPTKNRYFFRIDFWKVFSSFLHHFWITFSMKFLHCLLLFSRPFFGCYFSVFSHFHDFLFFGRTLADTCFTRGFIWFTHIHLFRKRRFFVKSFFEKYQKLASFPHRFFIKFHHFFDINFRIDLFIDFWWKMAPKWLPIIDAGPPSSATFSRHFRDPLFYVDFMLNLAHFWLTFGSLWLPFASLWLTFGSLWLPFGSLLAPFGSLLVPLGSLLLALGLDFLTFGLSWRHFSFFWVFSMKSYAKSYYLKMFIENQIILIKHIAYSRRVSHVPKQEANNLL